MKKVAEILGSGGGGLQDSGHGWGCIIVVCVLYSVPA